MTKGVDPLKYGSPAYERRQRIHGHNALLGHVSMAKAHLSFFEVSITATPGAKRLAKQIDSMLGTLQLWAKERDDSNLPPKGK